MLLPYGYFLVDILRSGCPLRYKNVFIVGFFRWANGMVGRHELMHKCLSCNRPCSMSSIFCDACRDSLLERGTEVAEEEQELVRAGSREGGTGELLASAPSGAAPASSQDGQGQEFFSAETDEERSWPQTGEEGHWSFETSGIHTVETVEEAEDGMNETDHQSSKV